MESEITVLIPAYNSERTIKDCLDSVINAEPQEKKIIVVNNNSSDKTRKIVESFSDVKILDEEKKGPAAARNKGLKEVNSEIVVFIDSDVIVRKNTITELLKCLNKKDVAGVGGVPESYNRKNIVSLSQDMNLFGNSIFDKKSKEVKRLSTMVTAYKMDILKKVNFFDESYYPSGEDADLSYKIKKIGYKLIINPYSKVYHKHPLSLKSLTKKWFNYGIGWAKLSLEHKRLFDLLLPILWILSLPLLLFLSFFNKIFILFFLFAFLLPWLINYSINTFLYLIKNKDLRAFAFPFVHSIQILARSLGIFYGFITNKMFNIF